MAFVFYPEHEYGCAQVRCCPHLGGAALGTLVGLASENQESREYLQRTIDAERKAITRVVEENERLKLELQQVKLELRLERQNKFATREQKLAEGADTPKPVSDSAVSEPKKRGAPVGHQGFCQTGL